MDFLIKRLDYVRVKVCSQCQLDCYYCHKEGFHNPKEININETIKALAYFKRELNIDSIKITGGEPTLFKNLDLFIKKAKLVGYNNISVTTNGLFDPSLLKKLKKAGVSSLHFSIRSLHPSTVCRIDKKKVIKRNLVDAEAQIDKTVQNILLANKKFNCVINYPVCRFNKNEIDEIVDFASKNNIELKLLNLLGNDVGFSTNVINKYVKKHNFRLIKKQVIFPTSDTLYEYQGRSMSLLVKDTRSFHFFPSCDSCTIKNKCLEGAYGLRVEDRPLKIRLCLQKNTKGPWLQSFRKFRNSQTMAFFRQTIGPI